MYRCSECGSEYKEKPEFCDCGNNIFEEIQDIPVKVSVKEKMHLSKQEFASRLVFVVCLILSIFVLLFFPKIDDKPKPQQKVHKHKEMTASNIPDIDTFWIDAKPQQETIIEQIKDVVFKPKQEDLKSPPVKQGTKQVVQKQKTVHKPQTTQKQQTVKPQQPKQTKPTPKPVAKQQQSAKPQSSYNYEILNYRTALRQRLLNNLDLYKIEGTGTCGIQFSVDETGKLINRNFIFQSENKSVNDEVYKMLMRTPRFNPPPEGYANKIIRIKLRLDSDSYDIKFLN